jgi:cell division protein FtsQ
VARGRNRRRVDREVPEAPPSVLRQGLRFAVLWALVAVALGALGVVGWRYLTAGESLRIRELTVSGASRASTADVVALSPVKAGDNLLAADVDAVAAAVARHPWVASATVHRRLPPALEVRVVEREPGALVDLGGLYLADRRGEVFKRAAAGDGLDLPLVTGFGRDDYLQRRLLVETQIRAALALLDEYDREGLTPMAAVSEVHVDGDGGVVLYVGDDGTQVRLGTGDLPQKLVRLRRVLEALRAEGRRAEVIHLDDRNHPDRVAVRTRRGGVQRRAGRARGPLRRWWKGSERAPGSAAWARGASRQEVVHGEEWRHPGRTRHRDDQDLRHRR